MKGTNNNQLLMLACASYFPHEIYFTIKGEEGFSLWNHTTGEPLNF